MKSLHVLYFMHFPQQIQKNMTL